MVSLQSAPSPAAANPPRLPADATPKKRKRDGHGEDEIEEIELNLDPAPLPLEWQQCLDIKSGQIHYYNTRTHKRTRMDPRRDQSSKRGLDLDLNLSVHPSRAQEQNTKDEAAAPVPPDAGAAKEMVAAVCLRCHMLVMLCRASPTCPNCKFVHPSTSSRSTAPPPPQQHASSPPKLGLLLLYCKD